ncbi:MAG: hypothetical protein AB7U82_25625 [Blastocatellales bacterium]
MWQRYKIPLLLVLLLLLAVVIVSVRQPWATRSSGFVGAQPSTGLECETFCSDTRVGVSVAEITFSGDAGSLSQLALEATVYKDGFSLGRLARVTPIRGGQKFVIIQPGSQQSSAPASAPGFDRLVLTAVRLQQERGLVTARVENLDAGLNYFWRVRPADGSGTPSGTTVCQATICPVEEPPRDVTAPR